MERLFGGRPSGFGSRVALQILAFEGKVQVDPSTLAFPARSLPFPVSGSWPIRDRAAAARRLRRGSNGRGRPCKGARHGSESHPAQAAALRSLEKTERMPRAALRPDGFLRDPARAPGRTLRTPSGLPPGERRDRMSESGTWERQARLGEFAPLGEVDVLAAPYWSRQARYPRAKVDLNPQRRCDHAELYSS
jgi:hypothetical protein